LVSVAVVLGVRSGFVVVASLTVAACRFGYELLPLEEAGGAAAVAGEGGVGAAGTGQGGVAAGLVSGGGSGGSDAGVSVQAGATNGGAAPVEHWFDPAFAKRRRLTFDNVGATDLLGFVVPLVLGKNELGYAALKPNGQDLRFVDDDDQTLLSYEIEAFVPGGISVIWLRLPRVPAGGSASAWMYSQNPGAADAEDAAKTWSDAFAAVYHLNGDATDSLATSDGVVTGAKKGAGQLASGLDFGSDADMVDAGSAAGVDDLFANGGTITAWIHPSSWGEGSFGRVADKASDTLTAVGWALQVDGGTAPNHALIFEHGFSGGLGRWNGPDSSIALGAWAHVAIVYDGSSANNQPLMYVNGVDQPLTVLNQPSGTRASDAAISLGIGDQVATKQRSFYGILDEVRLERSARTPDWIRAEYRSMLPGAVKFDTEQSHL
jgi:Concanavalin A-like lectin/glucanases superfamily/Domain of unknown function (DUF2341)